MALEDAAVYGPVSREQELKDSRQIEGHIFMKSKGDISRVEALYKDLLSSKAAQHFLPTGFSMEDTEAAGVASGIGGSVVNLVLAIKSKGPSATAVETTLKELVIALAAAEVGIPKAIRAFEYQSNPDVVRNIVEFANGVGSIAALMAGKQRAPRGDKCSGDPVFEEIWHHYTGQVKGKRGTKRQYTGSETIKAPPEEMSESLQKHPPDFFTKWKADNPKKVSGLKTGSFSARMLDKNRCFCVGGFLAHNWGACANHEGVRQYLKGLHSFRQKAHANCTCKCEHCKDHGAYFKCTSGLTGFKEAVLCQPCGVY